MIIVYKCGIVALKRSSDLGDPGPRPRRIFALLKPGLFTGSYDRGYYGDMVVEAARTVFRGMGVNLNAEPVQGP